MQVIQYENREDWLAGRNLGLGASDVPVALGLTSWKSPFQLWAEKTGLAEEEDLSGNEWVEWGLRLEGPIGEAFGEKTEREVKMFPQFRVCQHREFDFLRCTPDAEQKNGQPDWGLLQIKTTNEFKKSEWIDEPPLAYQVQLQAELAVTGRKWGSLAVLIGGNHLRYFDMEYNPTFTRAMIGRLKSFWEHVETKDPPPVDDSAATAKVLFKLHPQDSGGLCHLPEEFDPELQRLSEIKEKIKALEKTKRGIENQLKSELGDATFGCTPLGQYVSWKTTDVDSYTVAARSQRTLRLLKNVPKELK